MPVLKNIIFIAFFAALALIVWQRFSPRPFVYPKEKNKPAAESLPSSSTTKITDGVKHSIPLEEIYDGGPGKDGIPSIDHPKFISVSEAQKAFKPNGLGLAVSLNSEDRFYPYQILVWHELVNDKIANMPILVSFCPLCGSGLVFDRRINGQEVEFGVSGKLHNSDLLMYDRKTDSLWQQILGEAVVGPLTGTKLIQLEANVIEFKTFAEKFPKGLVLSKDTSFIRDYENAPYGDYDNNRSIIFPVGQKDARLHPKTRVLGVELGGKFKAYPLETLQTKGEINDTFAGQRLKLNYNQGLIKIVKESTGEVLVPVNNFWFAWFAFHPDTELYR